MSEDQDSAGSRRFEFDIEKAIATWRQFHERERSLSVDDLDELEAHLRDEIDAARRPSLSDEEVYRIALKRVGDYATIGGFYRKVYWEKRTTDGNLGRDIRWQFGLVASYIKTAWRGVTRHKAYAVLNLSGLAVALTACLVIGIFISHSLSFDRFLENADRIFRIEMTDRIEPNHTLSPNGLSGRISDLFPEAEIVTEMHGYHESESLFTVDDKHYRINGVILADDRFLDVFSFELLRGDTEGPLDTPDSIVLTESTAKRIFGDSDPIGRIVRRFTTTDLTVTAIAADPPAATHLPFNALITRQRREGELEWKSLSVRIYVKLAAGSSPEVFESKLNGLLRDTSPEFWERGRRVHVQPITRIHLHSSARYPFAPTSDIRYLLLFGGIGLLILLIACINYMNLATARSSTRAREIGVRKVVGASRGQLARQLSGESLLLTFLSFPLAILLTATALPLVNSIAGESLTLGMANQTTVWVGAAILLVVVSFVGGSYPALLLSSFRPSAVFKGDTALGRSHHTLRKTLVGVQVVASFALIVGTFLFHGQMDYVRTRRLGFDQSQIVMIRPWTWELETSKMEVFKDRAFADPSILKVATGVPPGLGEWSFQNAAVVDSGDKHLFAAMHIGYDYIETMRMTVLEGRSFSKEYPSDEHRSVIVEESLANILSPGGSALGLELESMDGRHVVGIVEDIQNVSLHERDIRNAFILAPGETRRIMVRISANQVQQGLRALEAAWDEISPDRPFEYEFLDEQIEQHYASETRLANIFGLFSGLSIFVSCLGLFGLAAFSVEQRTREIGIRKALGATISGVVVLLSKDYIKIVAAGVIVTTPLVFLVGGRWLENFAYHIEIGPSLLLSAGATVLGFVLVAVGYQSVKAALANPSDALRHE